MRTHVLRGSKHEIAESLVRITGEVSEVIVFEDEPAPALADATTPETNDVFAEMRQFMVDVEDVDDSCQAIYTRIEGE